MAENKEHLNIKDAYSDPRFNSEIDLKTGYKTNIILSMPICNYEGDVIGVAQIINKTNGEMNMRLMSMWGDGEGLIVVEGLIDVCRFLQGKTSSPSVMSKFSNAI